MKTTADFLDALRVKFNLPSDGQLADYLGIHRQYISRYRRCVTSFDDEMAMKVADLLDTDPAYVVACMHYQRAKHLAEKKLWERIAGTVAGVSIVLAVVAVLPFIQLPHTGLLPAFDNNDYYASVIYIMRIAGACLIASAIIALLISGEDLHDDSRHV